MHRETSVLLEKGFYKFFIGSNEKNVTSAYYRCESSGFDYQLTVVGGKNPRLADYKEELPTAVFLDSGVGILDSLPPESITVYLRLDEKTEKTKRVTIEDYWKIIKSGSLPARVKAPEEFTVESELSKAQAEIKTLIAKYDALSESYDIVTMLWEEADHSCTLQRELIEELYAKLNPPAPSPLAFPTIQHDTGPWRK